jgi:DNA recombination protein RmuC
LAILAGVLAAAGGLGFVVGLARGRSVCEQDRILLAQMKAESAADQEKLQWLQQAESTLRESFDALASRSLIATSDELLKRAKEQTETLLGQIRGDLAINRSNLQGLVDPLKTNLDALGQHVRDLEQKREGAYRSLEEQMRELGRTHSSLQTTTLTLAQALKSQTTRGTWGEIQLRRVVELANMVDHIDFDEQATTADAGRPDMIVNLSNGGVLPVDSKVPLTAYLEAIETCDEDCRRAKMVEHSKAMQSRIRELGSSSPRQSPCLPFSRRSRTAGSKPK